MGGQRSGQETHESTQRAVAVTERRSLSSASPFEELFGFCRAVKVGNTISIAGTAPIGVDGTTVGGCSFIMHVEHAMLALSAGIINVAVITHGESGRSRVGVGGRGRPAASLAGQFEAPFGPSGPPTLFTLPVLRYMKDCGLSHEQLAMVLEDGRRGDEPVLLGTIELVLRAP